MRKLLSLITVFVISLLTVSLVAAVPSESNLGSLTGAFYPWDITVEVNGEDYRWDSQRTQWWDGFTWGTNVAVEEGEDLDIKVTLRNQGPVDAKGIEVLARISGYEYSDSEELQDTTGLFDVKAGTRKSVKLNVPVPTDLTNGENALRIFGWEGNLGKEGTKNYTRPGGISLASSRTRDRFFVGILDGTICGNQPEGKKNSGKKSKSIRYNKKIAGHGFNDAQMRSRYERVV